jgi:hypothetical protein
MRPLIKKNWREIIVCIFGIVGVLYNKYYPKSIMIALLIPILSLIAVSIFKGRFKLRLNRESDIRFWSGDDGFRYVAANKCFRLFNAPNGTLFTNGMNWTNFQLMFRFQIVRNCFGVLLRATNLDSYVMLQINLDKVIPHCRNDATRQFEPVGEMAYSDQLSTNNFYECNIRCVGSDVKVAINDLNGENIIDNVWRIPDRIRYHHGTFGFRAWNTEEAFIKKILAKT